MPTEWDGSGEMEEPEVPLLKPAQIFRVLRMQNVLRELPNYENVALIKRAVMEGEYADAIMYWSDFTEEDQEALWVAPLFGGIFTTEERKRLRPSNG